ncbi:MAG: PaaI family thioesterase [Planctomycetota bacterium]
MSTAKLEPTIAPPQTAAAPGAFASWLPRRGSIMTRVERFLTRLSTKNNFWQKACSMIWLPYAFHSGIRMKRLDSKRFMAVLPFRRFNRNWYNAMAGAALLGNSEIAGGLYLLGQCGSEYIIVCKEMKYRFLRPCLGPAVYHIQDSEDIEARLATQKAFNIKLDLEIRQRLKKKGRELRVGRCDITFHCTPKALVTRRSERNKK